MVRSSVFVLVRARTDDHAEKVKNAKPDLTVLKDYQKREEEFLRRAAELSEVSALRDQKKEEHEALKGERLKKFLEGFNQISLKLKEMYQVRLRQIWLDDACLTR